jgi:hypothetical protein
LQDVFQAARDGDVDEARRLQKGPRVLPVHRAVRVGIETQLHERAVRQDERFEPSWRGVHLGPKVRMAVQRGGASEQQHGGAAP